MFTENICLFDLKKKQCPTEYLKMKMSSIMNTSLVIQYQINSQGELTEQGGTKYELKLTRVLDPWSLMTAVIQTLSSILFPL